jgi:trans-2,3-dihydro-3-hydroxyanthranilate isomerase
MPFRVGASIPLLWIKAGKEQLVVPLTSVDAIRRCTPKPQALRAIASEDGIGMAYVFALDGPDTVLARFFFPQGAAVLEDPATGSATANFGGWCLAMQRALPLRLTISQGESVGRPSLLYLEVSAGRDIFVGGDVLDIARGGIEL